MTKWYLQFGVAEGISLVFIVEIKWWIG